MKISIYILLCFFLICNSSILICEESDSTNTAYSELLIWNLNTSDSILVKVIPVGFIFSGDSTYSPKSKHDTTLNIFGGRKYLRKYVSTDPFKNHRFYLNNDYYATHTSSNDSSIGWGKYKIEFWKYELNDSLKMEFIFKDSLTIDYGDFDYPYSSPFTNDFFIYYYSSDNIRVKFENAMGISIKISNTERNFEMWNQKNSLSGGRFRPQIKYGFKSNASYLNFPLRSEIYSSVTHLNPGQIDLNILVNNNIYSNTAADIILKTKSILTLDTGVTFDIQTPSTGFTQFTIQDSSLLLMRRNSKLLLAAKIN